MSIAIVTLLGIWLLLSALAQLRYVPVPRLQHMVEAIRARDVLAAVPNCALFAPYPPSSDVELFYRDRSVSGSLSGWRRVELGGRPFWKGLWNPDKRCQKIVIELTLSVIRQTRSRLSGAAACKAMYVSFPYVMLADYVAHAAHGPFSSHTQFLIALSSGVDQQKKPAIVFISPLFAVCSRSPRL